MDRLELLLGHHQLQLKSLANSFTARSNVFTAIVRKRNMIDGQRYNRRNHRTITKPKSTPQISSRGTRRQKMKPTTTANAAAQQASRSILRRPIAESTTSTRNANSPLGKTNAAPIPNTESHRPGERPAAPTIAKPNHFRRHVLVHPILITQTQSTRTNHPCSHARIPLNRASTFPTSGQVIKTFPDRERGDAPTFRQCARTHLSHTANATLGIPP